MNDESKDKMKQTETEENRKGPRIPPMGMWDTVMDELIQEAMRNGEFDNLPGKGKPLNLSTNPLGKETELAYSLLKNNDYTLPWIATRREIFHEIEAFRAELGETFEVYSAEYRMTRDEMARSALAAGWRHFLNGQAAEAIERLNKKIFEANLKQPREVDEILKLKLKRELERVGAAETLG